MRQVVWTLPSGLTRRLTVLGSPARDVTVTADGRSPEIAQYGTGRGATRSLPLPAYLLESGTDPD